MPFYKEIERTYPKSLLLTSGEAVGLPQGIMGNSEVGHTNIGAGRIVYQDLTRINKEIKEGYFKTNKEILNTIRLVKENKGRLHLFGLLSDAGVHSSIDHLFALLDLAFDKVPITVHVITDGRDTPPTSGIQYAKKLCDKLQKYPGTVIGSLSGRYYTMDRDQRYERIEKAYHAMVGETENYPLVTKNGAQALIEAIQKSYDSKITDEFILPVHFNCLDGRTTIEDNDGMIFFNFRADRARQITRAFTDEGFTYFKRLKFPKLCSYLCFTQYDKNFNLPVAFPPQNLKNIFPEILANFNLRQFRIAETEKYAHVTYFFNGGREQPFLNEDRLLIPSPKDVPTYDLKPEMSAFEVSQNLSKKIESKAYDFLLVNFANPDMIGHTGNYTASIKALEAVDQCLNQVISSALACDYTILLTADHGNIEEMVDEHNEPHTQHTLNPVPFFIIQKNHLNLIKLRDGILADVAPTMLNLMGIPKPHEMDGKNLIIE
jgi:2,3-bisphosphoglycerate-independent phosphoglycerate mutase